MGTAVDIAQAISSPRPVASFQPVNEYRNIGKIVFQIVFWDWAFDCFYVFVGYSYGFGYMLALGCPKDNLFTFANYFFNVVIDGFIHVFIHVGKVVQESYYFLWSESFCALAIFFCRHFVNSVAVVFIPAVDISSCWFCWLN